MNGQKKHIRIYIALCAVAFITAVGHAQDDDRMSSTVPTPQLYYPLSIDAGGELWYPLSNYAYRMNFGGVYSAHFSFQDMLVKHINAGLEYESSQVSAVSPEAIRIALNLTNIFYNGVGLKIAYYSNEESDWFFSPSISAGYIWIAYNHLPDSAVPPPGGWKGNTYYITPRIAEGLKVNDELRISLEVSYTFYPYKFNPAYVGINTQYSQAQQRLSTTQFGWGFGITYFIGKPKSR